MRILAILPGDEWRGAAGVRIRYDRLRPELERRGHRLDLVSIGDLDETPPAADACLFCKTHDARTLLFARHYRAAGVKVGIDLFDDYFSQADDPRFVHLRRWFRQLRPALDFALCATPRMAERLAELAPGLAVHLLNDPAPGFAPEAAAAGAGHKAERALATGRLDLGWFGIGDNPHFSVGLADLHAFQHVAAAAAGQGFEVRLRVLTNRRAMTPARLEMLARLPLPVELEEWSEAGEADLIGDSLACFLPVNGQAFSTVKSLNRGISTLAGGAQLLSAGFPLYHRLAPFVYRDPETLLADLRAGELKLRPGTEDGLAKVLGRLGDAGAEAEALADFLSGLPAPPRAPWPSQPGRAAVLHGVATRAEVHKLAQRLHLLSVAVPGVTRAALAWDVMLAPDPGGGVLLTLSRHARPLLRDRYRGRLGPPDHGSGRALFRLVLAAAALPGDPVRMLDTAEPLPELPALAGYGVRMQLVRAVMAELFGTTDFILSEQRAPYWDPAEAPAPA